MPLNCVDCGRFVGKDGNPDIFLTDEGWEVGYPRCAEHWRIIVDSRERIMATIKREREIAQEYRSLEEASECPWLDETAPGRAWPNRIYWSAGEYRRHVEEAHPSWKTEIEWDPLHGVPRPGCVHSGRVAVSSS